MSNSSDRPLPGPAPVPPETLKAVLDLWEQAGEAHWIPVHGTSMLPMLHQGDQVLVAHGKWRVRGGDIVVFQRPDGLVAHRVLVAQSQGGVSALRTKGDNVLGLDPPLSEEGLVGRVLQVRRDEKALNLDTRLWRWVGRWVALVMLAQAWLYHHRGSESAGALRKIVSYLCLRIMQANGLCLRAILAVSG